MAVNIPAVFQTHQFTIVVTVIQLIFIVLFALFSGPAPGYLPAGHPEVVAQIHYTDFQDIHVVLIVGFGFLVAFLRRYGFASFSLSLLIIAIAVEWALIVRGYLSAEFSASGQFIFTIAGLVRADFTAAVVLISFGALIGKITPIQAVILTVIEVPVSVLNEYLLTVQLRVVDVGGSIVVHVFGAVFGLAVSKVLFQKGWAQSLHQGSIYHSEVFTFIGTAFLWVFWPALNAVNVVGDARNRAIINSYVALLASTVTAFLVSQALNSRHHFNVRHIASAALAGGVAMGVAGIIIINPWHAIVVGAIAGALAIRVFTSINPLLLTKVSVHDTRGVLALHALPGILGGIASAFFLAIYPVNTFPSNDKIIGVNRDKIDQALFQLAGLGISIVVAAVAGVITGVILKLKVWNQVKEGEYFSDADYFDVPDDFDFTSKVISQIERVEIAGADSAKLPLLPTSTTAITTTTVEGHEATTAT